MNPEFPQSQGQQPTAPLPVPQQPGTPNATSSTIPTIALSPTFPVESARIAKQVKNASRTSLVLGVFILVISAIMFFGVSESKNTVFAYIAWALYVLGGIGYIAISRKLKKVASVNAAKSTLIQVAVVSGAVLSVAVINSVVEGK